MAAATTAVLVVVGGPASGQSSEDSRLDSAEARLAEVRQEIERAEQQRSSDAAELARAQRQLGEIEAAVGIAEQAVQRQQRSVLETEERLQEVERNASRTQRLMVNRAVEQYKRPPSAAEAVLSSGDVAEVLQKTGYLRAMSRADRELTESLSASGTLLEATRAHLQVQVAALEDAVERKRALLAEADRLRDERALQLAASEERLGELNRTEDLLESEQAQIAAIARRSRTPAASRSSTAVRVAPVQASSSTGWVWPTSGPVTSEFGPRWGRMHEGIDIGAPTGAAIYAAAAGVVSYAGWMGGYGQLTLIDHGSVVTAYAHQSQIGVSVGQRVDAGEVIGAIGATGNVTGPHLHFETRVGGTAQNPRNYLP